MPSSQPTVMSLLIWDYRFKFRRLRMSLSRIRLGARGSLALARILNADELPFDVVGMRFERAYKNRKEVIPLQHETSQYSNQIVAEKSFAIAGINRFINIAVRPYTSVEEAMRAYDHFADLTKKRYAFVTNPSVEEGEIELESAAHVRMVETQGDYMGDTFRIHSLAYVVSKSLLVVEFQCTATSQWSQSDFETVIRMQIEKLLSGEVVQG